MKKLQLLFQSESRLEGNQVMVVSLQRHFRGMQLLTRTAIAVFVSMTFLSLQPLATASAQQGKTIQHLREVESRVKKVVENNLNACVSISDGVGAGSGVIVSEDGLIYTAAHVMVGKGNYEVQFPDGRTARAVALGKNSNVDAGLVQIIDPGPWPHVEIGKSKTLSKGDWVVLLGHSGGFELGRNPPVRTGRLLGITERNQLETDAALIGGDSGGPLFDLDGKLVGIHSSIGDSIAENRHVMIEDFDRDKDRMMRGERWGQLPKLSGNNDGSKPPKLGVRINKQSGRITSVNENSPAYDAGMKSGDIAIEFDGVKLDDGDHLIRLIKTKITGDVVAMKIKRGERVLELEVRLR